MMNFGIVYESSNDAYPTGVVVVDLDVQKCLYNLISFVPTRCGRIVSIYCTVCFWFVACSINSLEFEIKDLFVFVSRNVVILRVHWKPDEIALSVRHGHGAIGMTVRLICSKSLSVLQQPTGELLLLLFLWLLFLGLHGERILASVIDDSVVHSPGGVVVEFDIALPGFLVVVSVFHAFSVRIRWKNKLRWLDSDRPGPLAG